MAVLFYRFFSTTLNPDGSIAKPDSLELHRGLRLDGWQLVDHSQPLVFHPGGRA